MGLPGAPAANGTDLTRHRPDAAPEDGDRNLDRSLEQCYPQREFEEDFSVQRSH